MAKPQRISCEDEDETMATAASEIAMIVLAMRKNTILTVEKTDDPANLFKIKLRPVPRP